MKIALIGPIPPPNGGMAMQTAQLCRLLTEHGHDVTLFPVNAPYSPKFIEKIPVVRSLFRLFPYFFKLNRQLRDYDVIHLMANSGWSFYLFAMPAIYIAHRLGVPIVVNYRGGKAKTFFDESWKNIGSAFKKVDRVIVPSGFLQDVFQSFNTPATIVPNIIDLSLFSHQPPKALTEKLDIIVTRNLEEIYDNETAIKAFHQLSLQLPCARLTIAGSGPLKEKLVSLCSELGIQDKVTFTGRLNRQEMANLYEQADVMINASTIDNMPNSLLEALACGVLVVSTNVGGIPYMVTHEYDALLVNPKDVDGMTAALLRLTQDIELTKKLSLNGFDNVKRYAPDNVIPQLVSIYQQVMK